MDKSLIYGEINIELKKILEWTKNPIQKPTFDLDYKYQIIFENFDVTMDFGFLYPIFSLVDVLIDSINHSRIELSQGYSVKNAIEDLEYIIEMIDNKKTDLLEMNYPLKKKLNSVYD